MQIRDSPMHVEMHGGGSDSGCFRKALLSVPRFFHALHEGQCLGSRLFHLYFPFAVALPKYY